MRVVFGIIYTPFIPGGEELEGAIDVARASLKGCNVDVYDLAADVLTVIDVVGDFDVMLLVAPSTLGSIGTIRRTVYSLPTHTYDPFEIVNSIHASIEGSLDAHDLIKALDAMLSAQGKHARLILYECTRGSCKRALEDAIREASLLAGCSNSPKKHGQRKEEYYEQDDQDYR
ncbi:hypothetical protein Pyrfu_1561 [Pyrolobus fumarii 1A]|uniref:Uncharacterized protein n=1 Tax=Pyrolobus fumarii (strain DSM 11204 / 1A) TaxID=694429 RepID=G0EC48_PYRF1|nr:hypothetical protein [Pyrolobus fumarii]AEM39418.1 hypothetical protein Pyrfu_1561 [Pyrolobus fumarii 1A]